ncbi:MAG: ABC transporter ATP-binding protein [Methanomassiliicoccaceae archaeon]|nr:ABC transporter ATP-binding protein [Methanomassiliicoccaceae archaeon]
MSLVIKDLGFSYTDTPVLKNICIDDFEPQLISILGPNGVGKSTLIHCINKILTPTEGTVLIDDVGVTEYSFKELAKKVGYVPCSSSDAFPLTVIDTVMMGRHPHSNRRSTESDLEKVYGVLKTLGITGLAMRSFDELSAGQHQKVMLARGLVQEPQILLLDEPTANLDIKHQMEVTRILRDLSHDNGILVVMISHDLNIAAKYSDKVILMHEGEIFAIGAPEEVLTEENIHEVYGVESRIVIDEGRPHLILRDPEYSSGGK